jgi:CHAT domain-containing protein
MIRKTRVEVYRNLEAASTVATRVEQVRTHFARYGLESQFALRHGAQRLATTRTQLGQLHQGLVAPLASSLPERLIIVPHGVLHYVPFHALFDGETYLIDRHQVSYAPSATLWAYCQAQPARPVKSALGLAAGDERIPHVTRETEILHGLFANARMCIGADATWSRLRQYAPQADLVHVAAHAVFREDNVLFSALRLADDWVTVNDLYDLQLRSALVVLTGCETGLSRVAPGDELLGLARALLAAGAATLVVSLWPVHDQSTAEWVGEFYRHLKAGLSPAAAVRQAQLALLRARPDPYYWAPFITVGRP